MCGRWRCTEPISMNWFSLMAKFTSLTPQPYFREQKLYRHRKMQFFIVLGAWLSEKGLKVRTSHNWPCLWKYVPTGPHLCARSVQTCEIRKVKQLTLNGHLLHTKRAFAKFNVHLMKNPIEKMCLWPNLRLISQKTMKKATPATRWCREYFCGVTYLFSPQNYR